MFALTHALTPQMPKIARDGTTSCPSTINCVASKSAQMSQCGMLSPLLDIITQILYSFLDQRGSMTIPIWAAYLGEYPNTLSTFTGNPTRKVL